MREARAKGRRPHKATHRTPNGIPASNLRRSDSPRRTIRRIPRRIPDVRFSRGPSSSWRPSWQPSSSSSPWKWLLTMSTHAWFSHPLPRMLWEGSGRRFDAVLTVIAHHQPHIDKELWMMMGKTVKRTSGKNPEIFPSLIATRAALIVVEFARDLVVTPRRCRRRAFASPIPSASTPAWQTIAPPRRWGS